MSEPPPPDAPARAGRPRLQAAPILAALVPLALLGDSVADPLTGDDYLFLHGVRETPLPLSLDAETLEAFTYFKRPVRFLLARALLALFGPSAIAFHAVSLALHAGCASLVFLLACRFGLSKTAALLASLVFSLQPRAGAPVLWVAASAECLAGLFVFLSLASLLRYLSRGGGRALAASLVACAAALLSKESAYAGLGAALAAVALGAGEGRSARRWGGAAAFLALGAAVAGPQLGSPLGREGGRAASEMTGAYLAWLRDLVGLPAPLPILLAGCALAGFVFGERRVRFCLLWIALSPLPYAPVYVGVEARFFYAVFAPVGLLAGMLLDRAPLRLRRFAYAAVGLALAFSAAEQRDLRAEWGEASRVAERIVRATEPHLESVRRAGRATFVDLPLSRGRAYVFNAGFAETLALRFGLDPGAIEARQVRRTLLGCVDRTPPGEIEPRPLGERLFAADDAGNLRPFGAGEWCGERRILPFVLATANWVVEEDPGERVQRLSAPGFSPRDLAVLAVSRRGLPPDGAGAAGVLHLDIRIARVVAEVESPEGAIAVVAEAAPLPGMRATVDGVETEVFSVDEIFHGIVVPPGRRRLEFSRRR